MTTPDPWREALEAAADWVENDAIDSIAAWGTNDPRSEYAEYVAGNIRAIRRPAASAWRELEAKLSRSGYEDERECAAEHEYTPDEIAANWRRVMTGRSTIPADPDVQRPSPEGLHAQKGREYIYPSGSKIVLGGVDRERLYSNQWDATYVEAPPRVPWRCRIGLHRWGTVAASREMAEAARPGEFVRAVPRCTRCHKEKP